MLKKFIVTIISYFSVIVLTMFIGFVILNNKLNHDNKVLETQYKSYQTNRRKILDEEKSKVDLMNFDKHTIKNARIQKLDNGWRVNGVESVENVSLLFMEKPIVENGYVNYYKNYHLIFPSIDSVKNYEKSILQHDYEYDIKDKFNEYKKSEESNKQSIFICKTILLIIVLIFMFH